MADIASLIKALKDTAVAQYGKGAPYREALASALKGDMSGVNQALSKSDLTPMDVATSFAPLGITAFHGSPYTFDKFDLSKIGTGEGAQAYGHGLYFAENPNVAKTYKMPSRGVEATAATHLNMYKTPERAISALEDQLGSNITQLGRQHTQDAIDLIKSGKATTGNMYTVDIADETIPKMLDWNKPISEQHPDVQSAISPIVKSYGLPSSELGASVYKATQELLGQENRLINQRDSLFGKYQKEGMTLSDAVKSMSPEDRQAFSLISEKIGNLKNTPQMASNYLQKRGVSGIRYLDQGSRDMGQGTNNYVVFDPNTVKILERK